jgi:hypothetical protein
VTYTTRPAIDDGVIGTSGRVVLGSWMEVDVSSLVVGDGTIDVALTNDHQTGISLASSEYAGFEPTLVVQTADAAPVDPKPISPPDSGDPMIAAAGDISCDPSSSSFNDLLGTSTSCHMMATSDLLLRDAPDAVLALGDIQYEEGALTDFLRSYDATWGRVKGITRPVPGNHEYGTSNASGYFDYFGAAAGERSLGYYSYDLGSWHIIALNSQCSAVGCASGTTQHDWLVNDLAQHPAACTLAYWHIPRFSSGDHGSSTSYQAFWEALYDAGAEVVLNGHDHTYERFAPQTPTGSADPARGIREFVVGTGGRSSYGFESVKANSEVRQSGVFGVLELTLHADSYEWEFVPEAGETFTDSGSGSCH